MKLLTSGLKWFTAVAVAVAGIGLGGGSLIAPDPTFAAFDVGKLTINGDMRIRPEYRRASFFNAANAQTNQQIIQQRIRLGFNYDVSPDVAYFIEFQDSRNWGTADPESSGNNTQNNPSGTVGVRQGYILVKNAGMRGLSLKIGRQKIIFGNHRLLGSFDWNNGGWSFDAIRADYASAMGSHALIWTRVAETNCADINTTICGAGVAGADADLIVFYNTFKNILPGGTIEPYWMYLFDSRAASAATTKTGRTQPNQKRHLFGTRINGKAVNKMIDYTAEIVWQTGTQFDNVTKIDKQNINAWAAAVKGGVTLKNMMWKPRLGFEVDYASGSGPDAEDGAGRHTFEGLFPTNHAHYGYIDRMAWKNMVDYSPQLLVRPDKASNLKINLHIFRLASSKDNWYTATQGVAGNTTATNQAASLGKELDIVYTRKFKEGKFGMQIGYGHFFTGEYGARSVDGSGQGGTGVGDTDSDWGYVSFTTKF